MDRKVRKTWFLVVLAAAITALVMPMTSAQAAPGNNGVVKIDGIPFDQHVDNEPHVGCVFKIDFWNYEQGNFNANVRLSLHPPTGRDILLDNDRVFIGGDPAGGGTDLDGERFYDLFPLLDPVLAHPQQGYHIKVKVRAPHSIGADTKYKVFWVTGCAGY